MKSKSSEIRCLYAASAHSADALHLGGVSVPDPFLSVLAGRRAIAVVNRLEYARVAARGRYGEVLELDAARRDAAARLRIPVEKTGPAELIRWLAARENARSIALPADFPAALYERLRKAGAPLRIVEGPFFPERAVKTDAEAAAIRRGNAAAAAGIRAAERALRESDIRAGRLVYRGATLSSERLRALIDQACLEKGAVAHDTIAAGGRQACDPHECGSGPLRPHQLIIVDVFPRLRASGYHGDLTRTFLKGRANDAQRRLVAAVREAQCAALAALKAGVSGATVHRAAESVFKRLGYETGRRGGGYVGFIHSTGHGLGLDVHEPPRLGPETGRLRTGHVVTVEPGLYYPGLGGCRIEDVVRVAKNGAEPLSALHYRWRLP